MQERIHKIIANAGAASRREAERIIKEGRVTVNGLRVEKPGTKADPERDIIAVDGQVVTKAQGKIYLMLHKPKGYVTTLYDPQGRPRVIDLIKNITERIYPVGRLDYNTEGLLILTNDGSFAHLLQHPRHRIPRRYLVKVKDFPARHKIDRLQQGIYIDNVKTGRTAIRLSRKLKKNTWYEVTLWEGRNRQLIKMFQALKHPVLRIIRVGFGTLDLGRCPAGTYRFLTHKELNALKNYAACLN